MNINLCADCANFSVNGTSADYENDTMDGLTLATLREGVAGALVDQYEGQDFTCYACYNRHVDAPQFEFEIGNHLAGRDYFHEHHNL